MFKIRLFKESLKLSLDSFESRFLVKTFIYIFGCLISFGALLLILIYLNEPLNFLDNSFFKFVCIFISIASIIWFILLFDKYKESPVKADKRFINKCFLLLVTTFIFTFLFLLSTIGQYIGLVNLANRMTIIAYIFGLASCTYLIPAFIGLYIRRKKTSLTLMQFMKYCYAVYLAIFLTLYILLIVFQIIDSIWPAILYMIIGLVILTGPIFTLYKLKMASPYIDYVNSHSLYKWEIFFTFATVIQLLQLPLLIMHVLIMFLSNSTKR